MIQLATAPQTDTGFQPPVAANDEKSSPFEFRRGRSGHAWPFLARLQERPVSASEPGVGDTGFRS